MGSAEKGSTFEDVFKDELDAIRISRANRLGKDQAEFEGETPTQNAHNAQLIGLAFSGGGIRSATFNLGVLQSLAKHRLLHRFDYVSTVSGGGYIGSWLHAWTKRAGGIDVVEKELAGRREPREIGFLRRFSNYLTPKLGLFSADTWSVVATYLRNLTLTLAALFPALALLVIAPSLVALASTTALADVPWLTAAIAAALTLIAFANIGRGHMPQERQRVQGSVQRQVVLPCLVAGWLGAGALWHIAQFQPMWLWGIASTGIYLGAVACAFAASRGKGDALTSSTESLQCAGLAGLAAAPALWGVASLMRDWSADSVVAWGGPLLTQVFAFAVVVHIGLMGRRLSQANLEWWARLGAWLFIYNIGWAALFTIVLKGPAILSWLEESSLLATHGSWLAITIAGVLAGRSPKSGTATTWRIVKLLVTVAPYVFVGAVLALFSRAFSDLLVAKGNGAAFYVSLLVVLLGYLVRNLDINRFSMHLFYRNRLVSCYLGASRADRKADPFTGFTELDDEKLSDLDIEHGPFPIVNTAINLVSGSELAWQERKAASFSFTPLHSGYYRGYRPTKTYGGGMSLGTALAISGAAASPNMGHHSSPSTALMMTFFNVRLGWWAANTAANKWETTGPRCGLCYLVKETLGLTDAKTDYVYLSDGGHFENLAAYELVRRRCRFIVLSDSGQDPGMNFDDLGNLIRKCRADFGIDIVIDVDTLRPLDGKSRWHCAVGEIRYDLVDGPDAGPGTLLYVKPSLTGDEPGDVANYASRNETFPHQTTGDQWFDESQFESYRRLGEHVADKVLEPTRKGEEIETLIQRLREAWYPPSSRTEQFSKHGEALDKLAERMRGDQRLAFLAPQIWPEWERLFEETADAPETNLWLPTTPEEMESGFLYCFSLLQFMENAYVDLRLEQEHAHPDNRGWMNLFKHWSWSTMVRVTWAVSASTFGARFQTWARRRLDLDIGQVVTRPRKTPARGSLGRVAALAYTQLELNGHECDLVDEFVAASAPAARGTTLHILQQVVPHPLGDDDDVAFTFGFALVKDGALLYLRVQDHLRKMGLCRRALTVLLKDGHVKSFDPEVARKLVGARGLQAFLHIFRSVAREVGGQS